MDMITHKCPNCGGALEFDPSDQQFHCPFCLSVFTEEEVTAFEEQQRAAKLQENEQDDIAQVEFATESNSEESTMDVFHCPSCGAEIVTDSTTAATYCYFCHNPVVLTGRLSGAFLPQRVLPFAIDKKQATTEFLAWAQKKWFVPKNFFNQAQIEKLTGVYFPYWVVDAKGNGDISGTATKVRVWRVGDIEYTETKKYAIRRKGVLQFSDLVKNALSKNMQKKMVESVQPFPLNKAVTFKNQYLAGFQAEKRDIEYEAIQKNVEEELKGYSKQLLENTINGYASYHIKHTQLNLEEVMKNYVLLPVWLVTYRDRDHSKTTFYYAMNGQTGKVSGVLPISYQKLGLVSLGIFAGLSILLLIGGYFL